MTTESWIQEIAELQSACHNLVKLLPGAGSWRLLLEYVLPVVGQRVDCILLADDIIYVIEYKSGTTAGARTALQQAQNYALNLQDFHEASRGRTVVPFAMGFFGNCRNAPSSNRHGAVVCPADFPHVLMECHARWSRKQDVIEPRAWEFSRYFPVPTIIEAACAAYQDHDVRELAHSRAGEDNLGRTEKAIAEAVLDARRRNARILILVTGVPGAGKTLAGLNAVQRLAQELDADHEQASFMSGNGPLVAVIQEALKRSVVRRGRGSARSVLARVREIHRFVRDTYSDHRAPASRVIVFDEAQRAWTAERNRKKFGRDIPEPEMVLQIMARHSGWAVIVALIGGGQEIHSGEAGLAAWGDALQKHPEWEVITSPEALDGGASVAGSRLFRGCPPHGVIIRKTSSLHLAVPKRTLDSEDTAAWVNAVLDGRVSDATRLAAGGLPIYMTRDLSTARDWLKANATGYRRVGLVASSGAARLRADGVEPPTFNFLKSIDYVRWFLDPPGDYRSSNALEVALSEFEMQGLEIDFVGLLWGGDLIFSNDQVVARKLRGTRWQNVGGTGDPQSSADDVRTRILNKYRVLMTRFRKSMVIFVPPGLPVDPTHSPADFDNVSDYLRRCGLRDVGGTSPAHKVTDQYSRSFFTPGSGTGYFPSGAI
jgi:hypothetical protein